MERIAQKFPDARVTGTFTVEPGREVFGDLKLRGRETSLDLRDAEYFPTHQIPYQCITGVLHDLSKVTLLGCFEMGNGTASRYNQGYRVASIAPQFIAFGDAHVPPNEAAIQSIAFVIDDADVLFHDYDAFGSVSDPGPHIERIVKANNPERKVAIGPYPHIHYFTGKTEIIRVET